MMRFHLPIMAGVACFCATSTLNSVPEEEFWNLSIEQLLNTPIISASKKEERLFEVPAAISLITAEMIERSGSLTIPELLKGIPGLAVARGNPGNWSITSRGFGGRFANKLLVLKDGRSIYNTGYSGVYWNTQNMYLNDIERIEVVRGPGGTHWGANAMNGVINIISKSAFDTQGSNVQIAGGNEIEHGFAARYGTLIGDDHALRITTNTIRSRAGNDGYDSFNEKRFDLRWDSVLNDQTTLNFQGGYSMSSMVDGFYLPDESIIGSSISLSSAGARGIPPTTFGNTEFETFHVLGKYEKPLGEGSFSVKTFAEFSNMDSLPAIYNSRTLDLEVLFHNQINETHDLMVGAGARQIRMDFKWGFHNNIYNAFVQDEIKLTEKDTFAIGAKIEYFTDLTGAEFEPSIHYSRKWNENHLTWASISRAIRSPSAGETQIKQTLLSSQFINTAQGPLTVLTTMKSSEETMEAEKLTAFEIGHRCQLKDETVLNLSAFYNSYEDVITMNFGDSLYGAFMGMQTLSNEYFIGNALSPDSFGVEFSLEQKCCNSVNAVFSYSYLNIDMGDQSHLMIDPSQLATNHSLLLEKSTPTHQYALTVNYDILKALRSQVVYRYIDKINTGSREIPAYSQMDMSLVWSVTDRVDVSLVGRNLLDDQRLEYDMFLDIRTISSEVRRSFHAKINVSF